MERGLGGEAGERGSPVGSEQVGARPRSPRGTGVLVVTFKTEDGIVAD